MYKCSLTIVAFKVCYAIIPMIKKFNNNYVDWNDIYICNSVSPETLMELIKYHKTEPGSFRDNIIAIGNCYQYQNIDYDPEVLFNEFCPTWYRYVYSIDDPVNPVIWNIMYDEIIEYFELA